MMPAESLNELISAILQLSGCGSTLLGVAEGMPNTALTEENAFCPEVFVRSMAFEIKRQVDIALSRVEEVEKAFAASTAGQGKSAKGAGS